MNIHLAPSKILIVLLLVLGSSLGTRLRAQATYLEQVGGSEVELLMFLKSGEHRDQISRNGALVGIVGKGLEATYTVQRALVVHLNYRRDFPSEADALAAFDEAKAFLEERGVEMQVMRGEQRYRLMSGEGNGLRSTLVITAAGEKFRLNVEMVAAQ